MPAPATGLAEPIRNQLIVPAGTRLAIPPNAPLLLVNAGADARSGHTISGILTLEASIDVVLYATRIDGHDDLAEGWQRLLRELQILVVELVVGLREVIDVSSFRCAFTFNILPLLACCPWVPHLLDVVRHVVYHVRSYQLYVRKSYINSALTWPSEFCHTFIKRTKLCNINT